MGVQGSLWKGDVWGEGGKGAGNPKSVSLDHLGRSPDPACIFNHSVRQDSQIGIHLSKVIS